MVDSVPPPPQNNPAISAAAPGSIKALLEEHAGAPLQEITGHDAKRVGKLLNELYAVLPEAVPEAKVLPPMPAMYTADTARHDVSWVSGHGAEQNTAGVLISSKSLRELNDQELKTLLGHEMGHGVANANPELLATFIAANPERELQEIAKTTGSIKSYENAAKDFSQAVKGKIGKEQFASFDPVAVAQEYRSEEFADMIAMRLTADPADFKSAVAGKIAADKAANQAEEDRNVPENIRVIEQRYGVTLSGTEQQKLVEVYQQYKQIKDHPSDEARIEATQKEFEQLSPEHKQLITCMREQMEGSLQLDGGVAKVVCMPLAVPVERDVVVPLRSGGSR